VGDNGQLIPACAFWLLGDEVLLEEDNFENLREKKAEMTHKYNQF